MSPRLEKIVRRFAGDDAGAIGGATTFAELGFDSCDMIDLVLEVEVQLRVRLPDKAIAGLSHFGALCEAVIAQARSEVPV